MTRQNRVTPFGDIVAYPERGTFIGNRGILHDQHGQLTARRWTTHAWITCRLEFKERHREIMSPGTWTELFFLDEATALAAGHRPCGECRREDYKRFKACWLAGNGGSAISIREIDRQIHAERVTRQRTKVTYQAAIESLPDGTFISLDAAPYLLWQDDLWRWTPGGYTDRLPKMCSADVTVLTPESIVNALKAGYKPLGYL